MGFGERGRVRWAWIVPYSIYIFIIGFFMGWPLVWGEEREKRKKKGNQRGKPLIIKINETVLLIKFDKWCQLCECLFVQSNHPGFFFFFL